LIGGLAAVTFSKVIGVVFLGEPRAELPACAHRPGWLMIGPLLILSLACLLVGLAAPWIVPVVLPIAAGIALLEPPLSNSLVEEITGPLTAVVWAAAGLIAIVIGLALLRRALFAGRTLEQAGTWDCGYARTTPRMQYTASSFVQPATVFFASFLRSRQSLSAPAGLFPARASFRTDTPDFSMTAIYLPVFGALARITLRLRWLQHGRTNIYIMYVALTLVSLLVWYLGLARGS
jgi:hypothetical protein